MSSAGGERLCEGRVCVVTGAGRGIGREHALMLAEHGAAVVVNDLGAAVDGRGADTGPAQAVVDEIEARGGAADGPRCQPSARASLSPEATKTHSVTPAERVDASQVQTGAIQWGSSRAPRASSKPRFSVMRVRAPGAMALTVTP